jgi:hypothetical protein
MRRLLQIVSVALCVVSLGAAQQRPSFNTLMDRTNAHITEFVELFSEVKCSEQVAQLKFGKNGKLEEKQESTFDYLVILTSAGGQLNLSESRLQEKHAKPKNLPLLVTNGFATLFLIFHPYYQGDFEFRAAEDEIVAGRRFARIEFRHIKGTRSPMAMVLRGREYPLDVTGMAWIEPDTGSVAKITAGLVNGLEDIGLRLLHAEVVYAPVFRDTPEFWFPTEAMIEVETPRQHWRNVHRFVDYKRFSVSTEESVRNQP